MTNSAARRTDAAHHLQAWQKPGQAPQTQCSLFGAGLGTQPVVWLDEDYDSADTVVERP